VRWSSENIWPDVRPETLDACRSDRRVYPMYGINGFSNLEALGKTHPGVLLSEMHRVSVWILHLTQQVTC
jgi:hypothetical protein